MHFVSVYSILSLLWGSEATLSPCEIWHSHQSCNFCFQMYSIFSTEQNSSVYGRLGEILHSPFLYTVFIPPPFLAHLPVKALFSSLVVSEVSMMTRSRFVSTWDRITCTYSMFGLSCPSENNPYRENKRENAGVSLSLLSCSCCQITSWPRSWWAMTYSTSLQFRAEFWANARHLLLINRCYTSRQWLPDAERARKREGIRERERERELWHWISFLAFRRVSQIIYTPTSPHRQQRFLTGTFLLCSS